MAGQVDPELPRRFLAPWRRDAVLSLEEPGRDGARAGETVLTAGEYFSGRLDWHDFDINAGASLQATEDAFRKEEVRTTIPVPVTYRDTRVVFLGDEAMKPEVFQERIRQKMEVATDKSVYLRGDGGVSLREFTEIIDRLKAAGVQNVAFVTKGPGEI